MTNIAVGGAAEDITRREIPGKGVKFRETSAEVDAVDGAIASKARLSLPRPTVEISESRWAIQ